MTDEKLYKLCKEYGKRTLLWRRKFIGLLPEVQRRKLYEKKGFSSIYEFAAKLAGLSKEQVHLALNLERRFEDKPTLKNLLTEGKASLNKLTRVVSIATKENEEELAEKVQILSRGALETLVRDERHFQNKNGLSKALFDDKDLHVQTFQLSGEVVKELNTLHAQGQDVNKILLSLLQKRKQEIQEEKEKLSEEVEPTSSHYISVKVRKILEEEHGQKCSIKTCFKPAREIHHSQRFSLSHSHDPLYLAPLCHEHHLIAHSIDQKVQMYRSTG
jgi:hypothetical protein